MKQSLILAIVTMLLFSCGTSRYPERKYPDDDDKEERRGDNERTFPFSALNIPKGHLPPPGECKIGIPGRPPGQQGPPQS